MIEISRSSRLYRLIHNIKAMIGIIIIATFIIIAIAAPLISTYDPYEIKAGPTFSPVSKDYFFGTDSLGRDMYSRIVYGSRISLIAAVIVGLTSMVLGTLIGLIAGYYGGIYDNIIMRIVDVFLSIPVIIIGISLAAIFNPSLNIVLAALMFGNVPVFVRVVRSRTFSIKKETFVKAAESINESRIFIMLRCILPSCLGIVLIQMARTMSIVVIAEAGFSFLGFGSQPPSASWGLLLATATQTLYIAPKTLAIIPGLFIIFLSLGFNFMGDGLRDIYDPKLR